jgi:hypothetical protein
MKTIRMFLMVSLTFATVVSLASAPSSFGGQTSPGDRRPGSSQTFELKYLSEVTSGRVIHTIRVEAQDFNQALVKVGRQCVRELLDRNVAREDIVDMCNNPRL